MATLLFFMNVGCAITLCLVLWHMFFALQIRNISVHKFCA